MPGTSLLIHISLEAAESRLIHTACTAAEELPG